MQGLSAVDVSEDNIPVTEPGIPTSREYPQVFTEVLSRAKNPLSYAVHFPKKKIAQSIKLSFKLFSQSRGDFSLGCKVILGSL